MWTNAVRRSLAWLWGYAEKWFGVGQTFEKSHSRQVFETCSLISREMVSVLQYHHQSSTTVIVKGIFLPVPIEQVEFNFAVLSRSIPFLGFFLSFSTHFIFLNSLLSNLFTCGRYSFSALRKGGVLTLSDYFRGSLQMGWQLSPLHL